ncbi:hypothetical protein [Klebsiella pneumoniae]|uniref:hypothetical protein n=1 Tax=Klebsiella pneumoniae TaxID=573 RepID=UPI0013D4139A|nr:hypothetical protein [Klebsiella pneumoniae]
MNNALITDEQRIVLLSAYGWNAVLWVSFVPLALAVIALTMALRRSPPALTEQGNAL